jgi:hypothetical protein
MCMLERRTYASQSQYLKKAVALRRKAIRIRVIEYIGGKCILCGYNKCAGTLDLHHKDSTKKV